MNKFMVRFFLFLCIFSLPSFKFGNFTIISNEMIIAEMNEKLSLETYLDEQNFPKTKNMSLFGFKNLEGVNFMVLKVDGNDKDKVLGLMAKFFLSLFPGRTEMNFKRGNLFTIVLFDPSKKGEAIQVMNAMDDLFHRRLRNEEVKFFRLPEVSTTK